MSHTVRRLDPSDAAALRDLRLEALRQAPAAYGSTLADWADRPVSDYQARIAGAAIFGAFDGADLVGLAALNREMGGNTRHRGLITMVYVAPAHRGQGLTVRLLEAIEAEARAMGLAQLELSVAEDNVAARRAYDRAGFEVFARWPRALRHEGRDIDEFMMWRRL